MTIAAVHAPLATAARRGGRNLASAQGAQCAMVVCTFGQCHPTSRGEIIR